MYMCVAIIHASPSGVKGIYVLVYIYIYIRTCIYI